MSNEKILFEFSEIAEILLRTQDIHHGHWGLYVNFGIGATNIAEPTGGIMPTAIVPILEIGIQEFPEPCSLTVDAAKVKPRRGTKPTAKTAEPSATKRGEKG